MTVLNISDPPSDGLGGQTWTHGLVWVVGFSRKQTSLLLPLPLNAERRGEEENTPLPASSHSPLLSLCHVFPLYQKQLPGEGEGGGIAWYESVQSCKHASPSLLFSPLTICSLPHMHLPSPFITPGTDYRTGIGRICLLHAFHVYPVIWETGQGGHLRRPLPVCLRLTWTKFISFGLSCLLAKTCHWIILLIEIMQPRVYPHPNRQFTCLILSDKIGSSLQPISLP